MTDQKFVVVGIAAGTTITISREASSSDRPQGLVLEADHGLSVGEVEASRLVFWADTAPAEVEVQAGDAGDLRVWNVWREGDLIQAWEGPARIDVDDDGEDLGLSCHDGHAGGGPDLVVRMSFDRAWTQPAGDD